MTDKALKAALLEKLSISKQALSQRVIRLQKKIPITTEEAVYLIAHEEGIKISRYLDKVDVERIRHISTQYKSQYMEKSPIVQVKSVSKKKVTKSSKVVFIAKDFKESDPILPDRVLSEAKEMASIYPLLYVLENSIRQFIVIMMEKYIGSDWWSHVSIKISKNFEERMSDEKKNSWHQKRGTSPIYYLDLNELPSLLHKLAPNICPSILPSLEWINSLIDEVYKSRCVLCHMNPLDKDSISSIKLRYSQWRKQLSAKIDQIK